jgi:SAM-dependent methyltransferase
VCLSNRRCQATFHHRERNAAYVRPHSADALSLPFEDESFDVIACQFGVMFFPDKIQGYREARRVLKSGGCFLFNVWYQISENEFADVITQALANLFPQDPPCFLARTPHGYHNVPMIRDELSAASFGSILVETLDGASRTNSSRDAAIAYCQGTPLRNESRFATHHASKKQRTRRRELWHGDLERALSKAAFERTWWPTR